MRPEPRTEPRDEQPSEDSDVGEDLGPIDDDASFERWAALARRLGIPT